MSEECKQQIEELRKQVSALQNKIGVDQYGNPVEGGMMDGYLRRKYARMTLLFIVSSIAAAVTVLNAAVSLVKQYFHL